MFLVIKMSNILWLLYSYMLHLMFNVGIVAVGLNDNFGEHKFEEIKVCDSVVFTVGPTAKFTSVPQF